MRAERRAVRGEPRRAARRSSPSTSEQAHSSPATAAAPRYVERHRARGRLAHERIELLLDRDSPFLELSPSRRGDRVHRGGEPGDRDRRGERRSSAWCRPTTPRCAAAPPIPSRCASAARAATSRSRTGCRRSAWSSRAAPTCPRQSEIFIPGGRGFRDLTRARRPRVPTIALVFGNSTAGGAYVPGHERLHRDDRRSLQGVPRRTAPGEDGDRRGVRRRGARRRLDARPGVAGSPTTWPPTSSTPSASGAPSSSRLNWHKLGPAPSMPADEPRYDPDELLGIAVGRPAGPLRPARRARAGGRRLAVRRVQAALRRRASSPAGRRSTATPSGCSPTTGACCSARRRNKADAVHPARATRPTSRCCSCRTRPATWWARSTSSAASSRTAPR